MTRQAGLPPIRLHSLRQSLALALHDVGVTPANAAAVLGHRVDVYLSVYLPEADATGIGFAAGALGAVLARETGPGTSGPDASSATSTR